MRCQKSKYGEWVRGRRLAWVSVSLALWLLPAACSVGPDYVRPAVETPATYKEAGQWKIAQPRDDLRKGPWWETFNQPELNRLEEQVIVSNQNLAAAEAQYRQAQALVRQYRAGYFPTVTAGASVSRARASENIGALSGGSITNHYQLPVDLSWELDLWGKIRRSVESGQAQAQANAADLAAARLSAQAALAQNYFQLRVLDSQKTLYDQSVAALTKFLDLTRGRYANGVASRAELLQAETQLKTTQAQAIDLGIQRAQLEHAIATLIGTAPSDLSIPENGAIPVPPMIPVGVPSELLERRPDIASAERQAAAANARIGIAEAAYYPTLSLGAAAGWESTSVSKWLTWPSRFWSVGPAVSETLFAGGLRRAQTEEARAAYDAAVAAYRQTVLAAFQEVEDNLAALRILEQEARVQD